MAGGGGRLSSVSSGVPRLSCLPSGWGEGTFRGTEGQGGWGRLPPDANPALASPARRSPGPARTSCLSWFELTLYHSHGEES